MNAGIEQLMATQGGVGDTTRDHVLKRELLRQIIYTESGSLSVGTEVVDVEPMDRLAVQFEYPGETTAEYPVQNDTQTDRRYITWREFKIRLHRAQARYFVSDGAKLEGMIDQHMEAMTSRTSEALQRRKDENILGTLANGATSENELNHDPWNLDEDDGGMDIVDALFEMWVQILMEAPVNNMDITNMAVVVPARVYTELNKLVVVQNIQQRVEDYIGQSFGFAFYPHKVGMHEDDQAYEKHDVNLQDKAIMMIPGGDTAVHGELTQSAAAAANVPLVEGPNREFGRGEDYLITQWFNTAIMSHESGEDGVSPRIAVASGVNDNATEDNIHV